MGWKVLVAFVVCVFIPSVYLQIPYDIPDGKHELPMWAKLQEVNRYDVNGLPLWEGDIRIDARKERTARKNLNSRWPRGQIPYKIDSTVNAARSTIAEGMKLWTDNTCVTFVNSPTIRNQPHIVLKHTGTGCNSWVGIYDEYTTDQTVSLDHPSCSTSVSVVAHELGHAIGLWHEQDRLDRDKYLVVYKKNMGNNSVYFETSGSDVMHYDVPYEYASIMQYTSDAFNVNGRLTLVPRDPLAEPLMGKGIKPTFLDYKIVNRMYNCSDGCNLQCGVGYATSNQAKGCRCECPPGYSGANCGQRVYVEPPCGGKITTEQRIQSENYPNYHPANLKCAWLIEAPPGKVPTLSFHDFDLLGRGGDEKKCYWDAFRVRSNDLLSDDPGEIHCGSELLHNVLRSQSRQMLVVLTTTYGDFGRGIDMSVKFV